MAPRGTDDPPVGRRLRCHPCRGHLPYLVNTHLRQVGWDMKVTDPRHTGIYEDEIPREHELDN